jgi:hypothetical protein
MALFEVQRSLHDDLEIGEKSSRRNTGASNAGKLSSTTERGTFSNTVDSLHSASPVELDESTTSTCQQGTDDSAGKNHGLDRIGDEQWLI